MFLTYSNGQVGSTDEGPLGVENLMGSGRMAGCTAEGYRQCLTLTLVTSRSVGIGAYLVRLGQRVLQKGPPILLTGARALNRVLGRNVYTSNAQIGGPHIMHRNGVSHSLVSDDLHGAKALMEWMLYCPSDSKSVHVPLAGPGGVLLDPVERDVSYRPPEGEASDPRLLLAGDASSRGLFDAGSFKETLGGWARTVVAGRARLGGLPVGVIVPEARTVEAVRPADPADPSSASVATQQAGQVWFPDSAHKTAAAIRDFGSAGEQLPLFILANWRGFSGGVRDMFDEVLKFGAAIVEELTNYKQPVFVYIPPGAELRGGAWVVLDASINAKTMEMYADPSARGGVLEPTGTVELKFGRAAVAETVTRLDAKARSAKDSNDVAALSGRVSELAPSIEVSILYAMVCVVC